jgi:hypothetical protein
MSHHYSGPDFSFPHGDARLDFTDLYAFPKPGDTGKSILIMNVHPSAGENPPGPTTTEPFAPEALYELKIDTDGDAVADIAYRVRFSAFERSAQTATLRRVDGPQAANTGDGGRVIVDGAPISMGREARVTQAGDIRFLPAGAVTPSSATWKARRTTCSSRATISLLTKMFAASFLKYLTLLWGQKRFACGRAHLCQMMAAVGSKWSAEPGLHKRSYWSKREMPTSGVNPRTMDASLPASPTLLSTPVDIRRLRRSVWQGHCSQMFCPTTLRARRLFPITAGHSPTMRSIFLFASSRMERSRGTT